MKSLKQYHLPPGKTLGKHYQVLEFLGEGWEGEVYKVEEKATGIIRAAKLFYKHRQSEETPHISYAKRVYQLKSCPIVIQYHYQDTMVIKKQSVDFLISDFVDGEVLSQHINKRLNKRIPHFEALHLFYALVQGVEQIHFLEQYHGDIHSDNMIISRKGLQYGVHLIDLLHLGKPTRARIQQDVYDLINLFYEMIGGPKYYAKMPEYIKKIICGRKHALIKKQFETAGHIRLFLENLEWD